MSDDIPFSGQARRPMPKITTKGTRVEAKVATVTLQLNESPGKHISIGSPCGAANRRGIVRKSPRLAEITPHSTSPLLSDSFISRFHGGSTVFGSDDIVRNRVAEEVQRIRDRQRRVSATVPNCLYLLL